MNEKLVIAEEHDSRQDKSVGIKAYKLIPNSIGDKFTNKPHHTLPHTWKKKQELNNAKE